MLKRFKGQPSVPKDQLYRMIAENCIQCMGTAEEEGYRWEIGNCDSTCCPLIAVRPFQHLKDEEKRLTDDCKEEGVG
jgi:hypothetical protein